MEEGFRQRFPFVSFSVRYGIVTLEDNKNEEGVDAIEANTAKKLAAEKDSLNYSFSGNGVVFAQTREYIREIYSPLAVKKNSL